MVSLIRDALRFQKQKEKNNYSETEGQELCLILFNALITVSGNHG